MWIPEISVWSQVNKQMLMTLKGKECFIYK